MPGTTQPLHDEAPTPETPRTPIKSQPAKELPVSQRLTIAHQPAKRSPEAITANDTGDRQVLVTAIEDYLLAHIRPSADGGTTLADLYADYQSWAKDAGRPVPNQGFFGIVIEKAMLKVGVESDGRQYIGIKLASQTAAA